MPARRSVRLVFAPDHVARTNGKAERPIKNTLLSWEYARAYSSADQRAAELAIWFPVYSFTGQDGSLKVNTDLYNQVTQGQPVMAALLARN